MEEIESIKFVEEKSSDIEITWKYVAGEKTWIRSILYFPLKSKIVSANSIGGKIRIYDSNTFEKIDEIRRHEDDVFGLEKYSDDSFLSCSDDRLIICHSIESPFYVKLNSFQCDFEIYKIRKLPNDRILALCTKGNLRIFDYNNSSKIMKKYHVGYTATYLNSLEVSKIYDNCFYVPINSTGKESIRLVDYEKDIIFKNFANHEQRIVIASISIFTNSKNEEILIAIDDSKTNYIYNTSSSDYTVNEIIKTESSDLYGLNNRDSPTYSKNKIFFSLVFGGRNNNKYLFCGSKGGGIYVYEINNKINNNNNEIELLLVKEETRIHCAHIYDAVIFSKTEIKMLTCSSGIIRLLEFKGLKLDDYETTDLQNRIGFIFNEKEKFIFGKKKGFLICIKCGSFVLDVFKSTLFL